MSEQKKEVRIAAYARYAKSGSVTGTLGLGQHTGPVSPCVFAPHQSMALPVFS